MFINISDKKEAENKGSSGKLVNYLEKENRIYNKEQEGWFNHQGQGFEAYHVRRTIDGNVAKLSKIDPKFFLINISPSQKEIQYLINKYGKNGAREQLKDYAVKVMNQYAENFKRDGINSSKDLVWFAKLENNRYYTYKDPEVKNGTKIRGELKRGNQMHLQVIVSRKDATNSIKLSPMNKSRGRNVEHCKRVGQFNRVDFIQSGESLFDKIFKYERNLNETMAYANIKKNGNLGQRIQLDTLEKGAELNYKSRSVANKLARGVSRASFKTSQDMTKSVGKSIGSFMEILLAPVYAASEPMPKRKKKKNKGQLQDQSYGHNM